MKKYVYVNDLGYHKTLVVWPSNDNGEHKVALFANGECCGIGVMDDTKLKEYIKHYNAKEVVD